VSSETSFASKQLKMEPKLFRRYPDKTFVLVVSLLYRTASFGVSIEPKQKKDQPKLRV